MPRHVLLTGAGGFIGSHVLRHLLATTDWTVSATDSFRHRGKTDRITQAVADIEPPGHGTRLTVHTHDLTAPISPQMADQIGPVDYVIAMASQSHVDRSISDPVPFVRNNVDVILTTLEYARLACPEHVIVISTDEVYGPLRKVRHAGPVTGRPGDLTLEPPHREWSPLVPSNPYAASKAAQEAIAVAWWRTFGVPVTIVNCMNLIGEMQDREKYLPMLIAMIRDGATVPVHGRPGDIGTRHYLHARNLASALVHIFTALPAGRYPDADRPARWNVAGPDQVSNLELASLVADLLGKPFSYELVDFHSTRPGHDAHYGLDPAKLTQAGWTPPVPFRESLARTVRWTLAHPEWLLPSE